MERPGRRQFSARFSALVLAILVVTCSVYPAIQSRFWSWDWYWVDQRALGHTNWGGDFYDLSHHANPLPLEVQWYRWTLVLLGQRPVAHHALEFLGLLATLAVLYALVRRLGIPRRAGCWAVVLAGVAPAALSSWTWFAASPHLWAALLGLGSAVAHVAWRQGGSRSWLLFGSALALSILGLAMKNDALVGVLVIVAWEWLTPRTTSRPGRALVTAVTSIPAVGFLWWQATAVDPHRDQARTGIGQVARNAVELVRFAFLWRTDGELRAEFPPGTAAPAALLFFGAVVGAVVLVLAVVSLREPAGRVLVAAGLASLGPVAVLNPAVVSRYALPPLLLITAAAGAGAAHLGTRTFHRRQLRPLALTGALVAIAVWGTLAHLSSGSGKGAGDEEQALLAGLSRAGIHPDQDIVVQLVDSPLEPSTAEYRQLDPTLPTAQRLRRLVFLVPGRTPPPGDVLAIATRLPSGAYQVNVLTVRG